MELTEYEVKKQSRRYRRHKVRKKFGPFFFFFFCQHLQAYWTCHILYVPFVLK